MPLNVLLAVDRSGWCFHNISGELIKYLSVEHSFTVMPHVRVAREKTDIAVNLWWGSTCRVKSCTRARAHVACIYDGLSWRVSPEAKRQFKLMLLHADVLGVCNNRFMKDLQEIYGDLLPPMMLIEDGVDLELFQLQPQPSDFAVGWTGDSTRMTPGGPRDQKGVQLFRDACKLAGVRGRILDASKGSSWPHKKMPEFYGDCSAIACLGFVEGTPNPLLEGMASGRPILATRSSLSPHGPGLAEDLIVHGETGWVVDRDPTSVANCMAYIAGLSPDQVAKMGQNARKAVAKYTWSEKAKNWRRLFTAALQSGAQRQMGRSIAPLHPAPVEVVVGVTAPNTAREQTVSLEPAPLPISKPRVPNLEHPHVLAISDVPQWAFHTNMADMAEALEDRFKVSHSFVAQWQREGLLPDMDEYDIVFCVYHRWHIDHLLPWNRTVGSLRALWFFPEKPQPLGDREFGLVNRYRAFHVVTWKNYLELKDHCQNVVYLTNPVNMNRFPESTPVEGEVIASWNGNAKHMSAGGRDVKGFYPLILPVVRELEIPFEYVEYNTNRIQPQEMPGFYHKANLAICMSLYEGASNSTAEAMASGQALISTDVGNVREMHEAQVRDFGESGILFVERTKEALAEALLELRQDPGRVKAMGQLNRQEIEKRWSWDVWKDGYAKFLRKAL